MLLHSITVTCVCKAEEDFTNALEQGVFPHGKNRKRTPHTFTLLLNSWMMVG